MHLPLDGGGEDVLRLTEEIVTIFQELRHRKPRVHCLTNSVAQAFTANLLLAAGAIPSMSASPEEIENFVGRASALLVNLGTLDAERRAALPLALGAAAKARVPVVLDPVFVDSSPPRLALAHQLMEQAPAIIRLNGSEFQALAGLSPMPANARDFAKAKHGVVALTGAGDIVSDGETMIRIRNGHVLMTQVTGMGCASGALIAAHLAVCGDPMLAAVSGLAALGVAGEIAAETARGPGSFAAGILDALYGLDQEALEERAHVETEVA
ncbi:MAG: hydroxyethylthiazole kinase [Hyphomicrobiales bacterium]|nr:hydroxyethylthiazole kinase [Hyphomicrobiales bacterium]